MRLALVALGIVAALTAVLFGALYVFSILYAVSAVLAVVFGAVVFFLFVSFVIWSSDGAKMPERRKKG